VLREIRNVIATLRRHREDPEDVAKGVHMIDALGALLGRGDHILVERMTASEQGRRILAERRCVLDLLANRTYLRSLPEGTLGREYARFADTHQLFPEKLAEAVIEARSATGGQIPGATPEVGFLHDRYRNLHDLWHVVTGYETDLAGEYGIVALQSKQVGYRGMAITGFVSMLMTGLAHRRLDMLRTWFEGRRRGRDGAYLLAQDWEALVELPLGEVQAKLGFADAPEYRPFDYPGTASRAAAAA
jgi:ubiquinone biosynthesis protein COQ4